MPEYLIEPTPDDFYNHPCAMLFIEAAFSAREQGHTHIQPDVKRQLEAEFGLTEGESAALVYLADKRREEFDEELELDILTLSNGDIN